MSIYQRLQEDIKEAMKAHESEKLLALRTLNADIKKIHIDAGRREATDDDVVSAVTKAIKQRDDAATQMDAGGRPELAAVERSQAELFKAYQPAQLSAQELEAIVKAAIASTGAASAKDKGKVLGAVMPQVKGRADGKAVQTLVSSLLPA
jgi:uncharacterized protein YqeY